MNTLGSNVNRALRPDAQPFDEIRLVTIPRFKQSGLSGDEWRISVSFQVYRKGRLIHEDFCGHDINRAVSFLSLRLAQVIDDGKAYFAGEGDYCDQEGCKETATVTLRLIKRYCDEPYIHEGTEYDRPTIRKFCEKHRVRGNSSFDDNDNNYEVYQEPN